MWKCFYWTARRNLKSRMEEHNPNAKFSYKTDVTKHLIENPGRIIDFSQPEVLATASNLRERNNSYPTTLHKC